MKKFTLTLLASALVAGSASAYTLVDTLEQQEYGTKLDFIGSVRLKWQSTSNKTTDARTGEVTREHINHAVSNNGSRFGFKLTQEVGSGFYGIGRVEWRFRGEDNAGVKTSSQHDFDHLYTRQLYAGIGHKQYGELTYGNQSVITDEVKQTDLANTLSLSDGLLVSGARRSLQYVYEGIEGLKVGGFYGGSSPRANDGLSMANHRKDVWGLAAIKNYQIDKDQEVAVAVGTTKERFKQNSLPEYYSRTAYALGTAYTYDKTTIGLDWERRLRKDEGEIGYRRNNKEIRTVLFHKLTSEWRVYGMYAYKTDERTSSSSTPRKEKTNEFMVGTEYRLPLPASTSLRTFLEWKTARTKDYRNGELREKTRDNTTLIGMRYYW